MQPASFSRRLLAYNLDLTIFIILAIPTSILIENNTILYGACALIVILYHALFESSPWQATPGKKQGKMKVVTVSGDRLNFLQASVRILCKFLSLVLFFAGFFMIYFRMDRRGLHDLLAGTQVIDQK